LTAGWANCSPTWRTTDLDIADLHQAFREKLLESYRNGQAAGQAQELKAFLTTAIERAEAIRCSL
jgi:hypothetical protein